MIAWIITSILAKVLEPPDCAVCGKSNLPTSTFLKRPVCEPCIAELIRQARAMR